MRMHIMSECMCIQAHDKYHRKEIQEAREYQGLRGERAVVFFYIYIYGMVKEVSPEEIRESAMWASESECCRQRSQWAVR